MPKPSDPTRPSGEAGARPRQRKSSARLGPMPVRPPGEPALWWEAGACRDADPQLFFPADHGRARERIAQEKAALKLCARCPVRRICLEHALAVPERFGVWGGTTELERRISRRRRAGATEVSAGSPAAAEV
jgi:WhiB family redox-sensing transcriptional regulator